MCDCKTTVQKSLLDRLVQMNPTATQHQVELLGYGLILGKTIVEKGRMDYEFSAVFKTKAGKERPKKETGSLFFTYCPFCGEKYGAEKEVV